MTAEQKKEKLESTLKKNKKYRDSLFESFGGKKTLDKLSFLFKQVSIHCKKNFLKKVGVYPLHTTPTKTSKNSTKPSNN